MRTAQTFRTNVVNVWYRAFALASISSDSARRNAVLVVRLLELTSCIKFDDMATSANSSSFAIVVAGRGTGHATTDAGPLEGFDGNAEELGEVTD